MSDNYFKEFDPEILPRMNDEEKMREICKIADETPSKLLDKETAFMVMFRKCPLSYFQTYYLVENIMQVKQSDPVNEESIAQF